MSDEIKSGRQVVDEFFAKITTMHGVDKTTVARLALLYGEGKFTDINIQNALEKLLQEELKTNEEEDDKD